ncbi:MAG TPA: proline--tRNA ligase [Terriglobales bacterium]
MHRWSELFIPTLREAPADAELASHRLLLRAGYVRQLGAGIFSYLFLGQRALNKIIALVRREMDTIGQEFYWPALQPREIWEATGRWAAMGDDSFRLQDRSNAGLCLAMSAEEVVTDIARKELRSYKQLPQIWYQIQPNFRDHSRQKSGLLRMRQFVTSDSYSFDLDAAGLDASYQKHYDLYCRIFANCGLQYTVAEAHSTATGRSQAQAFMVRNDAGDDVVVVCEICGYEADLDKAISRLQPVDELAPEGDGKPFLVHTPGIKTIEDLARFLDVSPRNNMKTLAYMMEETDSKSGKLTKQPVVAFVRGDHQLNETKLSAALEGKKFRPMEADEIVAVFGSPAGFLGPIGLQAASYENGRFGPGVIVFLDEALKGRQNLIGGANRQDYHLKNLAPGRDFQPTLYADLRSVTADEACSKCGQPLKVESAIELGHISKLGRRYSGTVGARVLDRNGKEVPPEMGSYQIGIDRILAAVVEQNHDHDGFWLPPQIAPFEVIVTPISVRDAAAIAAATEVTQRLLEAGLDVLLDDRDERPGVKFKDADLVGIPYRINVGKKVTEGTLEVVDRSTRETRDASITAIAEYMRELLRSAR